MPLLLKILFTQTWILFICVTIINAFSFKVTSKKYIAENPELEEGYKKIFKGSLIYLNIPWVIMAIGNLSCITKGTFDYFAPRQMNPMVLLFHFTIIVLWVLSIRWIYFQNGAEFLEKHPGISNFPQKAKQIKWIFPLMLLGGVAAMVMMWVINPDLSRF